MDSRSDRKLAELSAKATSGAWAAGCLSKPDHPCNCRSILAESLMGYVFTTPDPDKIEEKFRSEYPSNEESAANMLFVCELVNAYRAGRLVDKSDLAELLAMAESFRINQDIAIKKRGGDKWCISNGTACLNTDNEWESEPSPSNREEDFIARTRFTREEAFRRARAHLDNPDSADL